jgi:hypothetical protein
MPTTSRFRLAILFATVLVPCVCACAKIEKRKRVDQSGSTAPERVETFGQKLGDSELVPLSTALANPTEYSARPIKVEGQVRRACSAKGCWMELAQDSNPSSPSCRVTFKDYGFFVPTDSAGSQATVEGEISVKVVRPGQVKHYEGEGATFKVKHEDGSADEVRFVATGVELRRH